MIENQVRKSVQFMVDFFKEAENRILPEGDTIDRISYYLTEAGDKPTVLKYLEWKKVKGFL